MKRITKLSTVVLSGLLVLLGFGGCKSAKRAAKDDGQAQQDTIKGSPKPIQIRPDDPTRMRLLYGPPPVSVRQSQEK